MAKRIETIAAQGDVLIIRTDAIPSNAHLVPRENGIIIVTHSETGHHHVIERPHGVDMYQDPEDPLQSWLNVHDHGCPRDSTTGLPDIVALVHKRSYDTHETLELSPGKYLVRRQREHTPEGWQRVQD